jgi:hypothetical protein
LDVDFERDLAAGEERWMYRHKKQEEIDATCSSVRPTARDIVRRFYAILP